MRAKYLSLTATVVFFTTLLFYCFSPKQAHADCDSACRQRYNFYTSGGNGTCFRYAIVTCIYCTNGMCLPVQSDGAILPSCAETDEDQILYRVEDCSAVCPLTQYNAESTVVSGGEETAFPTHRRKCVPVASGG
jgi:hypothetical protein